MSRSAVLMLVLTLAFAGSLPPRASASEPASLVELLNQIREGSKREEAENRKREAEFLAAQSEQRKLLEVALTKEARLRQRSEELEAKHDANEKVLPELEDALQSRMGTMGELFGVVRQVAGDTRSRFSTSIISAQLPGRVPFLEELAESRELPSIEDLSRLWLALQEEMTEQGRVVSFPATVIEVGGKEESRDVTRIGAFNVISEQGYLQYLSENGKLADLARQPASRYLNDVAPFLAAETGIHSIAIDPTRGSLLSLLIQAPSLEERMHQGGAVGYVIIVLGILGFALALYRWAVLGVVGRKIRSQLTQEDVDEGNALGRVLSVYGRNADANVETLELRLDEAILKESSKLQRGANLIKVLSVIAPLLGLLGTVTGMILTFQQITLFGTGDPKLMAGGISQALVTTVLGLVMAIPLTLLHSMISERSRTLVQILEESSLGLVAEQAERLAGAGEAV